MANDLIPVLPDKDIEVSTVGNRITGRIRQAAYTAAALAVANPVLLNKEVVYESDTERMKLGDGTTTWNNLPYFGDVQVGGTNLCLLSKIKNNIAGNIKAFDLSQPLVVGDTYTLSFTYTTWSSATRATSFGFGLPWGDGNFWKLPPAVTPSMWSVSFVAKKADVSIYNWDITAYTISFNNVKLERGNKPTDWSPAPEDIQQQLAAAKTYAEKLVADVQIGGVNLALNYNKKIQTNSYLIGTINLSTDLAKDDMLTISLDADIDDSQAIYIGLHPSSAELAIASKNSQGIYTATFKFKKDVNNLNDVSNKLQLYNYPRIGNLVGCVNRIKLERGNKPTDWSPAPEDVAADIATKIGDAPQDGKKYLRKDGAWNELTDSGGSGLVYSSSLETTVTISGGMYLNASAITPITCNIDWGAGAQFAVLVTRGDVAVSLPNRIQPGRVIYKMEGINDLIGTSSQKKVYCFMGINDGNPDSIWNTTYITVNCALYDQL